MNSERIRIWAGFTVISFVWGSTWLAIKIGLESVPPLLGAGARFLVAALILLVIVRSGRVRIPWTPDAKKVYAILGVISFGIAYGLVYWGEQYLASGLCSVLFAAFPFCVLIFSHLLLDNERLNAFKVAGIVLAISGLVVIFWGDLRLSNSSGIIGMAAVLLSAILQGLTLVLIKKYGQPFSPFAMNLVGMALASVLLLGVGFAFEHGSPFLWNGAAIGSIVYLAAVGSVLAFVTYYWLLKRIEAVYLALTTFINPIVALILGAVILGESLAPHTTAGAVLVLVGLLTANGKQLYVKFRAARQTSSRRPEL